MENKTESKGVVIVLTDDGKIAHQIMGQLTDVEQLALIEYMSRMFEDGLAKDINRLVQELAKTILESNSKVLTVLQERKERNVDVGIHSGSTDDNRLHNNSGEVSESSEVHSET